MRSYVKHSRAAAPAAAATDANAAALWAASEGLGWLALGCLQTNTYLQILRREGST